MLKKKKLEFNINIDRDRLEIGDFTWWIDDINTLYVSRLNLQERFGIFIETKNEVDVLYFTSTNIKEITNQFNILCKALNDVNPNIKSYGTICFNFDNEKNHRKFSIERDEELSMMKGKLYYRVQYFSSSGHLLNLILDDDQVRDFKSNLNPKDTTYNV
ncbi:MAG: hypothetical protein E7374_04075 [Clostridiales bacterium]|nr:hypothetical protein [Clostridiales bacterium]